RATKINVLNRSFGFNSTPRKRAFFSIWRSATPVAITENTIPAQTAINSAHTPPILSRLSTSAGRTLLTIRVRVRLKQGRLNQEEAKQDRDGAKRRYLKMLTARERIANPNASQATISLCQNLYLRARRSNSTIAALCISSCARPLIT